MTPTVLYVNHTATMSGGELALLDLLKAIEGRIEPVLGCPEGPLADAGRELGVRVVGVPGTDASLKLTPAGTGRAGLEFGRSAVAIRRATARVGADLVHANSIRSGIASVLSERAGGAPSLVHLHDALPPSRASAATLWWISGASGLLANSEHTRSTLPRSAAGRARVVYNPIDLDRFDPAKVDREAARSALGVADGELVLCMVAQLTPWKGQEDALRMLAGLRAEGHDATLLLVGSPKFVAGATRYDNRAYEQRLHALVDELELRAHVRFEGERDDVPTVLRASDALLMPSWEEPFGRAMIEALAMETPVLATSVGGPSEVIEDDVHGWLLPPQRPGEWVPRLVELVEAPERARAMGRAGRQMVRERFDAKGHATDVLAAYAQVEAA